MSFQKKFSGKKNSSSDKTYNDPPPNIEGLKYTAIEMGKANVEEVAFDLIQDSLPKTFINEINISTDDGFARLLSCIMARRFKASLEKDEIIEFVNNNRKALNEGRLEMFDLLFSKMANSKQNQDAAGLVKFYSYFKENVTLALQNKEDEINIKSDRLLWLLYALGYQLSRGILDYSTALNVIAKPEHSKRISSLSLTYMIYDYIDTIGTPNQPAVEYMMLIAECGLLANITPAVMASIGILSKLGLPAETDDLLDLLRRSIKFLKIEGKPVEEVEMYLRKIEARFSTQIPDEDL